MTCGCTRVISGSAKQNFIGSHGEEVLYLRHRDPVMRLCIALNFISKVCSALVIFRTGVRKMTCSNSTSAIPMEQALMAVIGRTEGVSQ